MAVSLQKGGNVNLSKEAPGLSAVHVGLGWDVRETDGVGFDLDAAAFLCRSNGKVRNDSDFIFYNNIKSIDGAVQHTGDNKTGDGSGDDEVIDVNLPQLPIEIEKVTFSVTIHDANTKRQNFGQIANAYIRIVNKSDNKELARFDLSEDGSVETAMVFGEIYRQGGDWKFKAVGQGFKGGLGPLALSFGVNLG
jgi:tellurium resistance protein TerD